MITLDMIEARKRQLEEDKAQLLANIQAIAGAIQDCEYWRTQLESETPTAQKDEP